MTVAESEPHIVREYKRGNTRIKIADDYCRDKTPEEVKATLRRIARAAQAAISAAAVESYG